MSRVKRKMKQSEGKAAETAFAQRANTLGFRVHKSTWYQDRVEHWDYSLHDDSPVIRRVEVKAAKRISRQDARPSSTHTWLEYEGNPQPNGSYNPGWLRGKATHVAFRQTDGRFLMIRRSAGLQLMERWAVAAAHVYEPTVDALHQLYHRMEKGKPRGITMLVTLEELRALPGSYMF
jgi:hypothetical protein